MGRFAAREPQPRIIKKLNELGCAITIEDVKNESTEVIGRPHIAQALVKKGYVKDIKEAFDKYLAMGKSAYVHRDRLTAKDCIDIITGSGGFAVLAHPGLITVTPNELDALVRSLSSYGLTGIEVYHPAHTPRIHIQIDGEKVRAVYDGRQRHAHKTCP
jgi:predicted metal-dependent phosphoesterase TrpH